MFETISDQKRVPDDYLARLRATLLRARGGPRTEPLKDDGLFPLNTITKEMLVDGMRAALAKVRRGQ